MLNHASKTFGIRPSEELTGNVTNIYVKEALTPVTERTWVCWTERLAISCSYTVNRKKEPTYFCSNFMKNQRILTQFSLLDLAMNDTCGGINFTHLT